MFLGLLDSWLSYAYVFSLSLWFSVILFHFDRIENCTNELLLVSIGKNNYAIISKIKMSWILNNIGDLEIEIIIRLSSWNQLDTYTDHFLSGLSN